MQTVSTGFAAACAARGMQPISKIEVRWNGVTWSDESAYMLSHRGDLSLAASDQELLPSGNIGRATVVLDNSDDRFSWQDITGPLYSYIGGPAGLVNIGVRIWQGFSDVFDGDGAPEYVRVFTGVIAEWTESPVEGTVTLALRDPGFLYAQQKVSTAVQSAILSSDWIEDVAIAAGIPLAELQLDTGIYRIPYVFMDDQSVVEEIWQTAQADGGRAYFDQLGLLRFETATHWAGHSTALWAFDAEDFEESDPLFNADGLATEIVVEWSALNVGTEVVLYELERVEVLDPGATLSFEAEFTYPALEVYPPVAPDADNDGDYYLTGTGGQDINASCSVSLSNIYAQRATVSVYNGHATLPARLNWLQLRGIPLESDPTDQVRALAPTPALADKRVRSVRGNPYMQTQQQATVLAGFLAYRNQQIRPVWRLRGMPGVPQLELGDRLSFVNSWTPGAQDPITGEPLVVEGFLAALKWQSDAGGFWQEMALLDAEGMYKYDDYFVIGQSSLGAVKRCWW